MRIIRGCIAAARTGNRWRFIGVSEDGFETLESNGIQVFPLPLPARLRAEELRRDARNEEVHHGHFHLMIARTERDFLFLRNKRLLVVLQGKEGDKTCVFFGRPVRASGVSIQFDTTSRFFDNGLLPFAEFADAERCANEVARQSVTPTHIAWIKFSWLS